VIVWAVSSIRGRVIVSVVHRVDSLVVRCLFTRSCSNKFIKFTDPTRRSGHNNLLHVLPRRVHITKAPYKMLHMEMKELKVQM
jgi:hypothetical protein